MREGSTKLWELERAEARGGSKLNNIFSSLYLSNKKSCRTQERATLPVTTQAQATQLPHLPFHTQLRAQA